MKTLIVYYSRSGYTRRVALALASSLQADLEEITEPRSRQGIFGYFRSAREAIKRIPSRITPTRDPSAYDLVAIGTPVWAGSLSPPVRTFLTTNRDRLSEAAFFCTMGGRGSEKVFAQMQELTRKPPRGTMAITDREIASGALSGRVETFAATIAPPVPAT